MPVPFSLEVEEAASGAGRDGALHHDDQALGADGLHPVHRRAHLAQVGRATVRWAACRWRPARRAPASRRSRRGGGTAATQQRRPRVDAWPPGPARTWVRGPRPAPPPGAGPRRCPPPRGPPRTARRRRPCPRSRGPRPLFSTVDSRSHPGSLSLEGEGTANSAATFTPS